MKGSLKIMKKIVTLMLGVLALPLCLASCAGTAPDAGGKERTDLIQDPRRIDFSAMSKKLFNASFAPGNAAEPRLDAEGIIFAGTEESRDPNVHWNISSMYKAAGYGPSEDGSTYVPFTPEDVKVIVLKIRAEWGGAFEMFYATGSRSDAAAGYSLTEIYGGDSEHFGQRVSRFLVFDASEAKDWATRFNDGFRLDYTNYACEGDLFLLEKAAFCKDMDEATRFIDEETEIPAPKPAVAEGYYVCLYQHRLHLPEDNVRGIVFKDLDGAKAFCDKNKEYGFRVANEKGEVVYTPYSLLVCDLLREGNYIVNYARTMDFKYGDSCTNPGINHRPKRTSCDRLMDWILYRAGFTEEQPLVQGCVVSNLHTWCKKMGFEKITDIDDLKAGDIVFVRPAADGGPQHVFMLASDQKDGKALRYDHGSDTRIQNPDQPTYEPVSYPDAPFIFAYRPVETAENNVYYYYYDHD